jgi:2-polyprenyl-3-methyl-5-hydroxy-6-metoxy-1,4-benzoquinol methylase
MASDWTAACLACGGALATELAQVYDTRFGIPQPYGIARCRACDLVQTVPRPRPDELGRHYARHYNFGGESGTLYTRLRDRFLASRAYRLWLAVDGDISFHARRGAGRLLDIGCNEGRGLALYAANGFTVEGLETNPTAAAAARGRGFTIHTVELAEFQPTERYDVAVLSNVLEHALDPAAMLAEVRRVLKPGGAVWISCPNARSWLATLFGSHWINWHVPFHIVHFSSRTLAATLAGAGLTVEQAGQATPSLWVAHSAIAAAAAEPGRPTRALRRPFLVMVLMALARGLAFPLLWLGNRLGRGDCLVVTARTRPD